jgi:hypothetical protein
MVEEEKELLGSGNKKESYYRITVIDEGKDCILYRATCCCLSTDHSIDIEIEYDKDCDMVFLNMYQDLNCYTHTYVPIDARFKWLRELWIRLTYATRLLWTGRIKINADFIFNDEKQIDDFLAALQAGRVKMGYLKKVSA